MSSPLPRPTVFPVWASSDQVDPISGQNNVLTPPPEKQMYGWARLEFPPRNWINWLARYTNNWIQYLAQQESQAVVTDGLGSVAIVDVVNGGMSIIYVVDTGATANYYEGIVYVPASYSSGILTYNTTASNALTVSAISVAGEVTVSGGTGPYIVYGQMKTIP